MNQQFEQVRSKLFGIAYRMLGSTSDAEDLLQDAYLRLMAADLAEIRSFEAFASTVVTRLCLDKLKSASRQREVYPGIWLPEPLPTTEANLVADPVERMVEIETLSMAFLLVLETLSAEERAVFLLREVFDYSYAEISQILEKSETACRQLLSRAKKSVLAQRPRFQPSHEEHQRIFSAFLQAANQGDVDLLTAILASDVTVYADGGGKATAARRPVQGRDSVVKLLQGLARTGLKSGDRIEVASLNGRDAIVVRNLEGVVTSAMLFETGEGAIRQIYIIRNPDKLKL